MKTKTGLLLVLILSAQNAHSVVIQGQSDPFPLDTSLPVPLTWMAMTVFAGLIGGYTLFKGLRSRKKIRA